ncbi:hypothetical protein SAMN05446037_10384 [Anaerovirgula multivorans]|uniref:Uncharacterized protein n=1 Tax=Anaerovirgula multivorans TaxID=312168 RepID=A0A239JT92_9FIRM|nr:hypothetical protein SAMN05446037_10384 [Anaerovirgula multivorans]
MLKRNSPAPYLGAIFLFLLAIDGQSGIINRENTKSSIHRFIDKSEHLYKRTVLLFIRKRAIL